MAEDPRKALRKAAPAAAVTLAILLTAAWASGLLGSGLALQKYDLGKALAAALAEERFPEKARVSLSNGDSLEAKIRYTINPELQRTVQKIFESYRPDYGSFVAIDPESGQVLAMVSTLRDARNRVPAGSNMALQARFPAASVFKVVTAAAAIDQRRISGDTIIPYNGANHTLYRRNVTSDAANRWTRYISVRDAFARSINTVFGKIGAYYLGRDVLEEYAARFGFNRSIASDLPFSPGTETIEPNQPWSLVEAASGFTRDITLSPLHAALIASSVANNGIMMEPYVVASAADPDSGQEIYRAAPRVASVTMNPLTATELRGLMQETVRSGTSRSAFRTLFKRKGFREVEVGGKTGSLTGTDPRGRTDWFVGYASFRGRQVAFAALTVHEHLWRVKSATVARLFLESYLAESMKDPVIVGSAER